jgi:hypothetical protein
MSLLDMWLRPVFYWYVCTFFGLGAAVAELSGLLALCVPVVAARKHGLSERGNATKGGMLTAFFMDVPCDGRRDYRGSARGRDDVGLCEMENDHTEGKVLLWLFGWLFVVLCLLH